MPATAFRRDAARILLIVAAATLAAPTLAADKAPTPEGARDVQAFFDRLLPAPAAGAAPLVSVKPDGAAYLVTTDLAAFNGLFRGAGADVSYDSVPLVARLVEQGDGKWRVMQDGLPRIVTHAKDATNVIDFVNYRQTIVIDPALAWWTSGEASADKGSLRVTGPKLSQSFEFGPVKADYATVASSGGAVSSSIKETVAGISFEVSGDDPNGKPASSSGRIERAAFNLGVDGLKSRTLFDLVSLLSAHRADLSPHEAEIKDKLRALLAPGVRLVEGGDATKVMIASPLGAIALGSAKLAVAVSNAGPDSAVEATVGAEDVSLPPGLMPPNADALTPSKIDLAFTVRGIDLTAAANHTIDGLHFDASGPTVSDVDRAKASAALLGAGPLKIVLAPSRIVAPAIDSDLTGELRYAAGRTSGAVTVKMRNFDKTMTAIKDLGPAIAARSLPIAAMAKGLAKTEGDGRLSWLVEIGEDRSLKINGIPLGKAPE